MKHPECNDFLLSLLLLMLAAKVVIFVTVSNASALSKTVHMVVMLHVTRQDTHSLSNASCLFTANDARYFPAVYISGARQRSAFCLGEEKQDTILVSRFTSSSHFRRVVHTDEGCSSFVCGFVRHQQPRVFFCPADRTRPFGRNHQFIRSTDHLAYGTWYLSVLEGLRIRVGKRIAYIHFIFRSVQVVLGLEA